MQERDDMAHAETNGAEFGILVSAACNAAFNATATAGRSLMERLSEHREEKTEPLFVMRVAETESGRPVANLRVAAALHRGAVFPLYPELGLYLAQLPPTQRLVGACMPLTRVVGGCRVTYGISEEAVCDEEVSGLDLD